MKPEKYDFAGYVTKNDKLCLDKAIIRHGAFKHNDGMTVPLVWAHGRKIPENILGNVVLEHRDDGVYGYGTFNSTPTAEHIKTSVMHGDINKLSIYANELTRRGNDVLDGDIGEVSLVVKGANKGAYIEELVVQHGDNTYDIDETSAIIYMDEAIELEHSDSTTVEHAADTRTIGDVLKTMNEEQINVLAALFQMGMAGEDNEDEGDVDHSNNDDDSIEHSNQRGQEVHKNVFDKDKTVNGDSLEHGMSDEDFTALIHSAYVDKDSSFKQRFLQHAADNYGITNIEMLFPEAQLVRNTPDWVDRRTEWVSGVLAGVHKVPFNRIRSMSADLTLDTARAKGYITGNLKKEEFFALRDRETGPQTIYKKQKLDKDYIDDITSFDVVAWMKGEMRLKLEEEIARAILIGDGREVDDLDKIKEDKIRPIATDDQFYTHRITLPTNVTGETEIEEILRARKYYKGTGRPTMYTTADWVIDHLLLKDKNGRRIYESKEQLASVMGVASIVEVEPMEGEDHLIAILVNLADYSLGSTNGGKTDFFDDFDIDFNQFKYLYETRLSGALTLPKSAVAIWRATGVQVIPTEPTFVPATGVLTVPDVEGVEYTIDDEIVAAGARPAIAKGASVVISARPAIGNYFPSNITTRWEYIRPLN